MTSRSGSDLPQLELDCLAALWALGPAPVAQVHARLAERGRPLAYTTVLTVLDRLCRKHAVTRQRRGRVYVFTPLVSRHDARLRALNRLIGNYYDSRQELCDELLGRSASPAPPPIAEPDAVLLD